jgi:hypothetical protein
VSEGAELAETDERGLLERGLGSTWERLAPLSVGSIASGAVIVGAGVTLRALLGSKYRRIFGWAGALALVPIGLWWWTERNAADDTPGEASDSSRSERPDKDVEAKNAE